jgi:hypothetical protein
MLINDTVLAEHRRLLKPEERLLLAVLEAAYWDLRSRQAIDRRQARSYFLSDENRHAFSFVAVCQHFGWSVDSVRGQLRPMLSEPLADVPLPPHPAIALSVGRRPSAR